MFLAGNFPLTLPFPHPPSVFLPSLPFTWSSPSLFDLPFILLVLPHPSPLSLPSSITTTLLRFLPTSVSSSNLIPFSRPIPAHPFKEKESVCIPLLIKLHPEASTSGYIRIRETYPSISWFVGMLLPSNIWSGVIACLSGDLKECREFMIARRQRLKHGGIHTGFYSLNLVISLRTKALYKSTIVYRYVW